MQKESPKIKKWGLVSLVLCFTLLVSFSLAGFVYGEEESLPRADSFNTQELDRESSAQEYVEGELIVKFEPYTTMSNINNTHSQVEASVERNIGSSSNLQLVDLPDDVPVEKAVEQYQDSPGVEYAEPNYIMRAHSDPEPPEGLDYFDQLWGLHNEEQLVPPYEETGIAGTEGADISALEAWEYEDGSTEEAVIAILDTGVDYTHPDLEDNMWEDDDSHGVNLIPDEFNEDPEDPMDIHGHGTHVAGTAAAVGYNEEGITGVSQHAEIMAVRVLGGEAGTGPADVVIEGIEYAAENGADVINMSLGSPQPSKAYKEAIEFAKEQDVLVVSSAGNQGDMGNPPGYPANYDMDNIISVAASDQDDMRAPFSNYDDERQTVHVAAPGDNIFSTHIPALVSVDPEITFYDEFNDLENWEVKDEGAWEASSDRASVGDQSAHSSTLGVFEEKPDLGTEGTSRMILEHEFEKEDRQFTFDMFLDLDPDKGEFLEIHVFDAEEDEYIGTFPELSGTTEGEFVPSPNYLLPDKPDTLKIVFDLNGSPGETTGEGVYIDNLEIIEADLEPDIYTYMGGTSMAAPHVAGLAGLLQAQQPDAGYEVIKEAILNNVDEDPMLEPFTKTGGRINAEKALASMEEEATVTVEEASELEDALADDEVDTVVLTDDIQGDNFTAEVDGQTIAGYHHELDAELTIAEDASGITAHKIEVTEDLVVEGDDHLVRDSEVSGSVEVNGDYNTLRDTVIDEEYTDDGTDNEKLYSVSIWEQPVMGSLGATGCGVYEEGEEVSVFTIPEEDWGFDGWTSHDELVEFDNAALPETTFEMPGEPVTVEAHFEAPDYTVIFGAFRDEEPVEGVDISVYDPDFEEKEKGATTGEEGIAEMELEYGAYGFIAEKDGYAREMGQFDLVEDEKVLEIGMRKLYEVTFKEENQLEGVTVTTPQLEEPLATDEDGMASSLLPEGEHEFLADKDGYYPYEHKIEVEADKEVEFELERLPELAEVEEVADLVIDYGTSVEEVKDKLQDKLVGELEDDTEVVLEIDWEADADYDAEEPGEYTFVGELSPQEGQKDEFIIPEELSSVEAKVTVVTEKEVDNQEELQNALANEYVTAVYFKDDIEGEEFTAEVDGQTIEGNQHKLEGDFTVDADEVTVRDLDIVSGSPAGHFALDGNDATVSNIYVESDLTVSGSGNHVTDSRIEGGLTVTGSNNQVLLTFIEEDIEDEGEENEISPLFEVTFEVVDEDGNPVEGAKVEFADLTESTDEEGVAEFEVEAGEGLEYRITKEDKEEVEGTLDVHEDVDREDLLVEVDALPDTGAPYYYYWLILGMLLLVGGATLLIRQRKNHS